MWESQDGLRYAQIRPGEPSYDALLRQTITVPDDMPAPTLSMSVRVDRAAADAGARFEARVIDRAGKSTVLAALNHSPAGWEHRWYDMTPWQGQTVTVELAAVKEPGGAPIRAHVDDVTLGSAAHSDTWAGASVGGILPGATGRLTLPYGNRGDVDAANVTLRLTLPAGVALLHADPAPAPDGAAFVWNLGALPAGAMGKIDVTLRNDTANGDPGRLTATITTGTGEIETGNNAAAAKVWGSARGWLPLMTQDKLP
jgi:hypothetical protein